MPLAMGILGLHVMPWLFYLFQKKAKEKETKPIREILSQLLLNPISDFRLPK